MGRVIGWSAAVIFAIVSTVLLVFSPLSRQLFGPNGDPLTGVAAILLAAFAITAFIGVGVTGIVACCMISKRLGYDQIAGLLLLIPIVNFAVLAYWAFRESPNERKLRLLKRRSDAVETAVSPGRKG